MTEPTPLSANGHALRDDDIRNTLCGINVGSETWRIGGPITCPTCLDAARATVPAEDADRLENDIRELRGANPGELAARLIARGWRAGVSPSTGDER